MANVHELRNKAQQKPNQRLTPALHRQESRRIRYLFAHTRRTLNTHSCHSRTQIRAQQKPNQRLTPALHRQDSRRIRYAHTTRTLDTHAHNRAQPKPNQRLTPALHRQERRRIRYHTRRTLNTHSCHSHFHTSGRSRNQNQRLTPVLQ